MRISFTRTSTELNQQCYLQPSEHPCRTQTRKSVNGTMRLGEVRSPLLTQFYDGVGPDDVRSLRQGFVSLRFGQIVRT